MYIYPKRRYAACPPPRLTRDLSFKKLQNWRRSGERTSFGWAERVREHGSVDCMAENLASKIPPKIIHNFVLKNLGPIRYPILGASWGVLERLGVSWRHFDASCGRPGSVLGRLGSVLGRKRWPTWLQLGSQNGPNIEKKLMQKTIQIWMPLGIDFFRILVVLKR